jgi:23S rRNA pseudouridine1911/1915/1917 synthase
VSSSILETPARETAGLAPPSTGEDPAREAITRQIPLSLAGCRLDQALAQLLPEHSRSRIQSWIRDGRVTLDGASCRPRDRVAGGEQAEIRVVREGRSQCRPQRMSLEILYQDADLLVVNKPAGLVVHPAAGNREGTLQNGLLHLDPTLACLPRCGIVHRLDKDTSGLMVVARSERAHTALVAQLQARSVRRQYLALVNGLPVAGGTVDAPIGRHPSQRTRMAVVPGGKPAVTRYRVEKRYRDHCLLEVRLETGRTHQIRVHLAHIRYPIVGDPVYGGRLRLPSGAAPELVDALRAFRRQALHAERLSLDHPGSGRRLQWQVPMPADMQALVDLLRAQAV